MKIAVITGAGGQDASYLAELLLSKDYLVVGVSRRRSDGGESRIEHLKSHPNYIIEPGDVTDSGSINRIVEKYRPQEYYNLAAMSFVHASWTQPVLTMNVNAIGCLHALEAIRNINPSTKFYQASTSELFGKVHEIPQKETTPHHPRSPYGVSKEAAYWAVINYRESFGLFATNGILFNHESPRRGIEFVTRKITDAAARIKAAGGGKLVLGNIDAKRDWGHAADYMEAAYLMLQQDIPNDYVIATGETHTIKDVLDVAFSRLGLDWRDFVHQDENLFRPAEVDILLGDSTKARKQLGWQPKYTFDKLITEMVDEDWKRHSGLKAGA